MAKKKKKDIRLKIHGTVEQVLAAAVKGNPKPKRKEKK